LSQTITLTLHQRIAEIAAADWDSCAGGDNPFVSHAFLSAMEDSGSTGRRTGWLPQHACFRDGAGSVVAVAPLYAKSHSYGEYVFDHGWAQSFERAGGTYYPKLQCAVPFSPVPGPRLLRRDGFPAESVGAGLAQACEEMGISSVHASFCTEAEWDALGRAGWLRRLGTQFHWENAGYASFDDFLGALSSRKRKQVRRERRDALQDLTIRVLRGDEIERRHWDAFYGFYTSTVDRKWGSAYLTRRFFPMLSERLGDRVVLMVAEHGGTLVAGALNLVGADTLYGRNWGAKGDWPFLHFELCYYQAIEFAIRHGLQRVEAGAQGEHKVQRGYLPSPTYSAHYISNPSFRRAVAAFLDEERPAMRARMEALGEESPYRRGGEG
jgi:predicted N-acyltransferase